jgi:hypothetical protein
MRKYFAIALVVLMLAVSSIACNDGGEYNDWLHSDCTFAACQ